MGHRSPDRISIIERRPFVESVGDMIRARWSVVACCDTCRAETPVDLAKVVRERGPGVSLWDRAGQQACRAKARCAGKVTFAAKAPGMDRFETLEGWPQPREPAWKRGRILGGDEDGG